MQKADGLRYSVARIVVRAAQLGFEGTATELYFRGTAADAAMHLQAAHVSGAANFSNGDFPRGLEGG